MLNPLLIAISIISVVMIIFFNFVIMLMLYSGTINDLNSFAGTIEQIYETADEKDISVAEIGKLYRTEVERRAVSYRTNMVIVSEDGKVIYSVIGFYDEEEEEISNAVIINSDKSSGNVFSAITKDDMVVFRPVNIGLENGENAMYMLLCEVYWEL